MEFLLGMFNVPGIFTWIRMEANLPEIPSVDVSTETRSISFPKGLTRALT